MSDEPTPDQVLVAKDAMRIMLKLLRDEGLRYASMSSGSDTYKALMRGGFNLFLTPCPWSPQMWRMSKGDMKNALKFW